MGGSSPKDHSSVASKSKKSRSPPITSPRPRQRRNSVSPKKDYVANEPTIPASENERWKKWMKKAELDMEELKQNSDKYECLYRRQKELCDTRTEELVLLEKKYEKLEKHCNTQAEVMAHLRLQQQQTAQELADKKSRLAATVAELKTVKMKADELSMRLPEVEQQLQNADDARRSELENLRSLQSSFEASERHFASVLEQVRALIHENESVYQTNCKLTKEKLAVDKELTLRMQISTALATQLAEAHDELKQINGNLKSLEKEKELLFKKLKEQRCQFATIHEELESKNAMLSEARQEKAELEGQLKLSNLCLSRALSDKNKAAIFPKKSESQYTESSASPSQDPISNQVILPQIRTLRDEISAKDDTIMRLIEEINKLEEELQDCRMDLLKEQEINKVNSDCFKNLTHEPKELEKEIQARDRVIDSLKVHIEKVIAQRNRLGLQCVRKKEQISLLKEKNRVLEDIMLVGNRLYDQGLKKIQDLKLANESPTVSLMMQKVQDIQFTNESYIPIEEGSKLHEGGHKSAPPEQIHWSPKPSPKSPHGTGFSPYTTEGSSKEDDTQAGVDADALEKEIESIIAPQRDIERPRQESPILS